MCLLAQWAWKAACWMWCMWGDGAGLYVCLAMLQEWVPVENLPRGFRWAVGVSISVGGSPSSHFSLISIINIQCSVCKHKDTYTCSYTVFHRHSKQNSKEYIAYYQVMHTCSSTSINCRLSHSRWRMYSHLGNWIFPGFILSLTWWKPLLFIFIFYVKHFAFI